MKAAVRHLKIRQFLESSEFLDVETLCRELETSEATVRRDLVALEKNGSLKRVYGGAMAAQVPANSYKLDYAWQSGHMQAEKQRMAVLAAGLVEDGQTVILDGGSSVAAVARRLTNRSLQVVTNSLSIAELFADVRQIEVILTGGYLYPRLRAMVGPMCEKMLSTVRADVLIMGVAGVTGNGFSNNNTLVVGPELRMMEASRRVIVVADHSKFGQGALISVAALDAADIVVSDTGLAPEYHTMLRSQGVDLRLA
jgi:DeoR/GlpR family transcriptional regulator of sugar metabolism